MSDDGRVGPGITVLEASAGTGKTHRVTTVVVTAVADGMALEDMLLVTFTIKATSELRDRVWRRLTATARALDEHLRTGDEPTEDLERQLCAGPRPLVEERLANLRQAAADFDAATIATIHSFCQLVLRSVGFAADVDRHAAFIEDIRPLRDEVVDDLLVQKLHRRPDLGLRRARALDIAQRALANPEAPLLPDDVDPASSAGVPVAFGHALRGRMERRKRERRLLDYDDLLERVAGALDDESLGVRRRLQERFRLVVVDEFQDTDTLQWRILRDAFAGSDTKVVLVGDPKQAIYAFRGADVHAYLAARAKAEHKDELDENWRSDADLLRGLDVLFRDLTMGDEAIAYRPVDVAPGHEGTRLRGGRRRTPVRMRMVARTEERRLTKTGYFQKDHAIDHVVADLAADIVRLLTDGTGIVGPDGPEQVAEADIAVLVRRNDDALAVQEALAASGVPAVVNGTGSVYRTDAALDWRRLLESLAQPASRPRLRAAALTAFVGWRADDLADASDAGWDTLHSRSTEWRDLLTTRGVAAMFHRICVDEQLPGRLLDTDGGERRLTDLRHLAELLHDASSTVGLAPTTLVSWLDARRDEAATDNGVDDRSRRLETDADAVQVWTVHRSKGQEFPIVYVPFAWMTTKQDRDTPLVFHDPERGERVIQVNGNRGATTEQRQIASEESAAEDLRLIYVALTRARHQVVLWWVPGHRAERSALAHLLFGHKAEPGGLDDVPADDRAWTIVSELASGSAGTMQVEQSLVPSEPDVLPGRIDDPEALDRARFRRDIDRSWRRTSYSALTAGAHSRHDTAGPSPGRADPEVAPEHSEQGLEDEWMPEDVHAEVAGDTDLEAELRAVPSVLGDVGSGAAFGTLVHTVLEEVDFSHDDLPTEVRAALADQYLGSHAGLDVDAVVDGLVAAIRTPLGEIAGGRALADITRADRLDELHFELPLVGGEHSHGTVTMDAIASVIDDHLADDPLLGHYADQLRDPALAVEVRGYLSGAIDVVMRLDGRFLVVDHKSNWLGVEGEELSLWHYRPAAMRDAMVRAHYPLQALIYSVALHRYLRWRLVGYDPHQHLGGIAYLFLRGMTGPDAPHVEPMPCGVFSWGPDPDLVVGLSDVFDQGAAVEDVR
ncbi:MAG: UvrD-helicase domain-containing protein [Acidimicrobiales bacterium]|nr:UvrD-helicase domain-containing protein [Acidimicrobiales bacterium]